MKKMRLIIIDDELLARERLRRLLSDEQDVEIVAECTDGPSAVDAILHHAPDLLLLDIQMPGMDGFDVIRSLRPGKVPFVVFVTGFDQHAIRAFEARALDYLLKPTTRERLAESIARAREWIKAKAPQPREDDFHQALRDLLIERETESGKPRRFSIRKGERVIFVSAEDVDWVEAAGNYAILHVGKTTHILRETMSALETQLPSDAFMRVSRSSIVNLLRVKELQSVLPGELIAILHDGQRIPLTCGLREIEDRMRFL